MSIRVTISNRIFKRTDGRARIRAALLVCVVFACVVNVRAADLIITDFDAAAVGSSNPRENWLAFGAGLLESGIHAGGSSGNGAFQEVNWTASSFGAGELHLSSVDLTGFESVTVDARSIPDVGHSGTARLRFALNLPSSTEWTSPSVPITDQFATYVFDLSELTQAFGSHPLDLEIGQPKLVFERNGQTGESRVEYDEVIAIEGGSGGSFELNPVTLRPPPDGDDIRAMWLYSFSNNLRVDDANDSQEILDFCAREGINQIYFGAFNAIHGTPEIQDNLHTFLKTASNSGIAVDALICGVEEYQNAPLIRTLIDEVIAFNDATPADSQDDFHGIHFDMEFWLSAAWGSANNEADRQDVAREFFDDVLANANNHLANIGESQMPMGVDLSAHFDVSGMLPSAMLYDGVTQQFLEHVLDSTDSVVLMSYIDSPSGLVGWTDVELNLAAAHGRKLILGADLQPTPPEVPINTYADNFTPTPFSAMTKSLDGFHSLLSAAELSALAGFSVFHYDGYIGNEPSVRNIADFDADMDVDAAIDYFLFGLFLDGPDSSATGLARDADFDLDGKVTLRDFGIFMQCFTGSGITGPIPDSCLR